MELKLEGKIKLLLDAQTFDSGFTKREFVITTAEQYPQDIKLEVTQQRVSLLDGLKVGANVSVSFNVRGNEYNGRYFVNLQAWKVDIMQGDGTPPPATPQPPSQTEEDGDDLPF